MKYIIGIDEAGRGPLAGPVTVGAFVAPENFKNGLIKILGNQIRDSKQLSPKKREEIFNILSKMRLNREIDFNVAHSSPNMIDKFGISKAVSVTISNSLKKLHHTKKAKGNSWQIRLDGLLKAPKEYKKQKTIIGGDAKNVFIACASIVAKVSRDRLMCRLAKKYPNYSFEIHKGYGTLLHRNLIKKFGLSEMHRKSFCKSITHPNPSLTTREGNPKTPS